MPHILSNHKAERSIVQKSAGAGRKPATPPPLHQTVFLQRAPGCACGGSCPSCRDEEPAIQTRLHINTPGDRFEQEADRVADAIIRSNGQAPGAGLRDIGPNTSIQRQPIEEEEEEIQAKETAGKIPAVTHETASKIASLQGRGQSLPDMTRAFFESRMGADFSGVGIHTGPRAAAVARAVNARAFTTGSDIVFGAGEYSPGTQAGRRLIAHELTHTLQQRTGRQPGMVQRTIGDGHDLTAPEFAGDTELEEVFDGEDELKIPDTGEPVRKVQASLEGLGFALPSFGLDGRFGAETQRAVVRFQREAGLSGADADGKVGKKTMALLDISERHNDVVEATEPGESTRGDFLIEGKHPFAADTPNVVFFDLASATIDSEEQAKIQPLVDRAEEVPTGQPDLPMTLHGFASEEGGTSVNNALIEQRMDTVEQKLVNAGHDGTRTRRNRIGDSVDAQFRLRRKVEILIGNEASSLPECGTQGQVVTCDATAVSSLRTAADTLAAGAITALSSPDDDVNAIYDSTFRTSETTRTASMARVQANFRTIRTTLRSAAFLCGNLCEPTCRQGAAIFVNNANSPSFITSCPRYFTDEFTDFERSGILLHEGAHIEEVIDASGQTVIGTDLPDFANSFERIFALMDTNTAENIADTYRVFAMLIAEPGSVPIGHKEGEEDVFDPLLDNPTMRPQLERGIAFLENWVQITAFDTQELHDEIEEERRTSDRMNSFFDNLWTRLSPRFGLTPPGQALTERDQSAVAAIADRYLFMVRSMRAKSLRFILVPEGLEGWTERSLQGGITMPGPVVMVSNPYFNLAPSRQLIFLLQELVQATDDITARLEPEYVAYVNEARQNRGVGGPTP